MRLRAVFWFAALTALPVTAAAEPILVIDYEQAPGKARYDLPDMLTMHPGDEYSPAELERNRRLLEATGLFRSVSLRAEEEEGGYRVTVSTVPYDLVEEVSLTGNFYMLKKRLRKVVKLKVGDPFREEKAMEDAMALLRLYEEEGYRGTQVQTELGGGDEGFRIAYRIREGIPGVIRSCTFEGNEAVAEDRLRAQLQFTLLTFFRQESLIATIDRLEEFYRKQGFLDVSVIPRTERSSGIVLPAFTLMNPIRGLATLVPGQYEVVDITLLIEEGKKYEVEIRGNERFTEDDLVPILSFAETGFFDEHEAGVSRRRILDFYAERGYFRAVVDLDLDREAGRVTYTIREGERYLVDTILFRGAEFFSQSDLLSRLKSWKGEDGNRPLRQDYLIEDRKRIRDHYQFEGFLDVEVLPPTVRLEASPEGAEVNFTVREGVQSLVSKITFTGVTAVTEEELREAIKSREDLPYRPGWVVRDKERILHSVSAAGYPHCRVREEVVFSPDRDEVVLSFIVDEGPQHQLGSVLVVGNRKTKPRVVRREIPLATGGPYSVEAVTKAKRNLYGLGFFEEVRITAPEQVEGARTQDMVVRVRERPSGLLRVGGGYSSDELFGGFVEVGEQNLFGTGRGLSLRAKVSTLARRYDLFFREPWPFGYRINSEADVFEEFREEDAYEVVSRGINLGVKRDFREIFTLNLKYRFEFVEYENITLQFADPERAAREIEGLDPISISSAIALLGLDLRDNPITPHRGSYHLAGVELATKLLGGDTSFNKFTFESSWFLPIGERSELAVGFRGGFAQTISGFDSLPPSERFFLGGARGVRGWAEDEVGPEDDAGNAIGGDTFALGILEFRFPLGRKRWRGVTFFDVGNVWADIGDFKPTGTKYSVGVGLRYNTLVGPLRLDYGIKLNPNEGDPAGRLHFNIGFPI